MSTQDHVPLSEATIADLKAFAIANGLEFKPGHKTNDLRGIIEAALPGTTSIPRAPETDQDATPAIAKKNEEATVIAAAPSPNGIPEVPMCELQVHQQKGEQPVVQVAVNGRNFVIERGKTVRVPYYVEQALRNAVEIKYTQVQNNPRDKPEMVATESPIYPYQVTELPTKAEIAAYEAAVADIFAPNA